MPTLAGVTRNAAGNTLGGVTVKVFRTSDDTFVVSGVSDASGNYSLTTPTNGPFYVVAYKAGSPDVAGTTLNTLTATGAVEVAPGHRYWRILFPEYYHDDVAGQEIQLRVTAGGPDQTNINTPATSSGASYGTSAVGLVDDDVNGWSWYFTHGGAQSWVMFDLGENKQITEFTYKVTHDAWGSPKSMLLQGAAAPGGPWTTAVTVSNTPLWSPGETRTFSGSTVVQPQPGSDVVPGRLEFEGVNLASAEFGDQSSTNPNIYMYPTDDEITYYADKGMNYLRVPFLMNRWVANLRNDRNELHRIVQKAVSRNMTVLLEDHNYGLTKSGLPLEATDSTVRANARNEFASDWVTFANVYKTYAAANVHFGLSNEPHGKTGWGGQTATWNATWLAEAYNQTIAALRNAGVTHRIVLCGTVWSGGHSWTQTWYGNGVSNGQAMLAVTDPNVAFDLHQYVDNNYSGTYPDGLTGIVSPSTASTLLDGAISWARTNNKKLIIGEYGFPSNTQGMAAGEALIDRMAKARDVVIGKTFWAGGPWWYNGGDSILIPTPYQGFHWGNAQTGTFNGQPIVDKPHMALMRKYHT